MAKKKAKTVSGAKKKKPVRPPVARKKTRAKSAKPKFKATSKAAVGKPTSKTPVSKATSKTAVVKPTAKTPIVKSTARKPVGASKAPVVKPTSKTLGKNGRDSVVTPTVNAPAGKPTTPAVEKSAKNLAVNPVATAAKPESKPAKATEKSTKQVRAIAPTGRIVVRTSATNIGTARGKASSSKPAMRFNHSATSQDPIQFPEESARLPKTYLTSKQLQEFKRILLAKRGELYGDVRQLTNEALNRDGDGTNDRSSMPIHMADLGSDNWEQEFTLGLIASERAVVREIDAALQRIADGTYGMCIATHKPIGLARLQAKPWASHSIEYARLRDEGRVP